MAQDDYFKIVYVILTELYECKKQNEKVDMRVISPARFKVPEGYLLDIFEEMKDEGYVKGFKILNTKTGRCAISLEDISITMKGIEYIQDNSKMQKVKEVLKTIKDIAPGL
ncbi:MAG: YjcQ family protein [Lachnospiraceae bacterium]